jgi:hypothetical protein
MSIPDIFGIVALCICTTVATSPVHAQENAKDESSRPASGSKPNSLKQEAQKPAFKIFRLKNMSAENAHKIASDIFVLRKSDPTRATSPRFAVENRTNSLLVVADDETCSIVEALLIALDSNDTKLAKQPTWRGFILRHATPEHVRAAISDLQIDSTVYADSRTNKIFVAGQAEDFEKIRKLIDEVDVPSTLRGIQRADVAIRLVWLVEKGLAPDDAAHVPEDLSVMIDALRKKVGLGELRTAAQSVVRGSLSDLAELNTDELKSSGTAQLRRPATLEFSGHIMRDASRKHTLKLRVSAREDREPHKAICEISTTCSGVILEKPIILGMTSVDSQSSVFVIQLLDNGSE